MSLQHFSFTRIELIICVVPSDIAVCSSVLKPSCKADYDQVSCNKTKIWGPGLASRLLILPESDLLPLHIFQCSLWIQIFSYSEISGPIYPSQKAANSGKLKLSSFITENTSSNSMFYFSINAPINTVPSLIHHIYTFFIVKHLLSFYCGWWDKDRKNSNFASKEVTDGAGWILKHQR